MKTPLKNEEQIFGFINNVLNKEFEEDEFFYFKMEMVEVVFKPRNKKKKVSFCRKMDEDVFNAILMDLGLPYRISKNTKTYSLRKIDVVSI